MRKYHKHRNERCNEDTGPDYTFNDLHMTINFSRLERENACEVIDLIEYLRCKYEEGGEMRCLECMD